MRVPPYVFQDAERPEPWRQHPVSTRTDVRLIPTWAVRRCADQKRLNEIWRKEEQYIRDLSTLIGTEGLKVPVRFTVDKRGNLRLRDGHHRLLAVEMIPLNWMPYVFESNKNVTDETFLPLIESTDLGWWLQRVTRSDRFSIWI